MQNITNSTGLKEAIAQLENKQAVQGQMLKEQFDLVRESLRPFNLIKNTLSEVVTSPDLIKNIFSAVIGLTAGYFSTKMLVGPAQNSFKKLLGVVLQTGILMVIATKGSNLKETVFRLFKGVFNKKSNQDSDHN